MFLASVSKEEAIKTKREKVKSDERVAKEIESPIIEDEVSSSTASLFASSHLSTLTKYRV